MEQTKYDVFISYSRKDLERVKAIKAEIEQATGARCWMDLEGIESGVPHFTQAIIDGIEHCDVFLFIRSEQSQKSKYALLELSYASEDAKKHVVIVDIDNSKMTKEFRFLHKLTHQISWDNNNQHINLLQELREWIGNKDKEDEFKYEKQYKDQIVEEDLLNENTLYKKIRKKRIIIGFIIATIIIITGVTIIMLLSHKRNNRSTDTQNEGLVIIYYAKEFSEGLAAVLDTTGKWGFIDKSGNLLIPHKWNRANSFSEGYAAVQNEDGKWGFIDKNGNTVISLNWPFVYNFHEELAIVTNGPISSWKRVRVPSEAGNVGIQPLGELAHGMGIIDAGATLHVGLAVHPAERRHDKVPATAERLIAGLGNVAEQPFVGFRARSNAHIGRGTTFEVIKPTGVSEMYKANEDNDGDYYDLSGRRVAQPTKGVYIRSAAGYGSIDKTGKLVIPYKWSYVSNFSEGYAAVQNEERKWGFIDKTGTLIIPCKWNQADGFSEDLARVKDAKDKWGYIDKTGELAIPCEWSYVYNFNEGLAHVVDTNEMHGFIDKSGNYVILPKWSSAKDFSEGLAAVKYSNGKWGYINKNDSLVVPCLWNETKGFSNGLALVQDYDERWGFIDKTNTHVIPCIWEEALPFSDNLARVKDTHGKWRFIDITGTFVIPYVWYGNQDYNKVIPTYK